MQTPGSWSRYPELLVVGHGALCCVQHALREQAVHQLLHRVVVNLGHHTFLATVARGNAGEEPNSVVSRSANSSTLVSGFFERLACSNGHAGRENRSAHHLSWPF